MRSSRRLMTLLLAFWPWLSTERRYRGASWNRDQSERLWWRTLYRWYTNTRLYRDVDDPRKVYVLPLARRIALIGHLPLRVSDGNTEQILRPKTSKAATTLRVGWVNALSVMNCERFVFGASNDFWCKYGHLVVQRLSRTERQKAISRKDSKLLKRNVRETFSGLRRAPTDRSNG